jgi:hypothetical protein
MKCILHFISLYTDFFEMIWFTLCVVFYWMYRGADKSLARPGRKQAAPVKSLMDRGMDSIF